MGSAFSKIVTSVVDDLLMPIIGIIIGGHDFSNLSIKVGESTIRYGFCIFLLVKFINKLTSINKKKEDKKEKMEESKKNDEVLLLEEILSELKKTNKK